MAVPFASAYQPINLLNNAIQAQGARQDQGYLDASRINEASISDALNRVVQQKALQQQQALQQQHYGLQQQQLANDLAYRNAALKEAELRSVEQARQFDKQFGLNEKLTNAQLNNPFFGAGKDFAAYGLQAGQDVAAHNAAATAVASQATGALAAARQAYKADVAEANNPNWYQWLIRNGLPGTWNKQDYLNAARAKFDANYSKILADLGPHRDKVSFVGSPEENGMFQPVLLSPPRMPGMGQPQTQSQSSDGSEGPDAGPVNIGTPDMTTPENQPMATASPFLRFFTGPGGMSSSAAQAAAQKLGGMTGTGPFSNFGRPTNAPPLVVAPPTTPGATNRIFRYDPNAGLVPIQ